jgi:hypothetical protein
MEDHFEQSSLSHRENPWIGRVKVRREVKV